MPNLDIRQLTPEISVAGQLLPDDMPALAAAGFQAVMINRPDGEEIGQPEHQAVCDAAAAAGLMVRYVPAISGALTDADVAAFGAALDDLPAPLLAFCRTGTRSTVLWALSQAATVPVDRLIESAASAGYDLAPLRDQLAAIAADRNR